MPKITGVSHIDLSVTDIERSHAWYMELLGAVPLFGGRNDRFGLDVRYIMEPDSGLVIGLEQHDANDGTAFDETRVGLDHLSFNVASGEELAHWRDRLDELGIPHGDVVEEDPWDVLVCRDPDNIQLEFFWLKMDPSEALEAVNSTDTQ